MDKIIRVLIVDDQRENRLALMIALKKEGYEFKEAENGQEAVDICKKYKPNIILMDAIMPVMDGFIATETIRDINECRQIPILMITALNEKDDRIKAIDSGVSDFISKPFDKHELIARCRSYARMSVDTLKRKEAEEALKEQHNFLQSVIDGIDDPIMVIKEDYTVDLMNTVVKNKIPLKVVADQNAPKCYEISHNRSTPCDGIAHLCPLQEVMSTKKHVKVIHDHSHDGNKEFIELSAMPLFDKDENCIGIIESGRDITSHMEIQKQLNKQRDYLDYQANHDILTGLANRALFKDRLEHAIVKAERHDTKIAIFFIDLDNFKPINDELGHDVGDEVLKEISTRLQEKIRAEDTIARIGGDEFTIIMENIIKVDDAEYLGKKIIETINKPIVVKDDRLEVSASIGISVFPDDERSDKKLLSYADIAMYKAKKSGKNTIEIYSNIKES